MKSLLIAVLLLGAGTPARAQTAQEAAQEDTMAQRESERMAAEDEAALADEAAMKAREEADAAAEAAADAEDAAAEAAKAKEPEKAEVVQAEADPAAEGEPQRVEKAMEHEVVKANTLWDLSAHYCKDPWQWPKIFEANTGKIRNPHWIYPGQVFVIPCVGKTVAVYPKTAKAPEPEPEPAPAPEPEPEPAPAPEPEPAAPVIAYNPASGEGAMDLPDSLSTEMPEGMTGQQPAAYRMLLPKDWRPDGRVVEFEGREMMVGVGDSLQVALERPETAARGQRYEVFRKAARAELDKGLDGKFVEKVGLVELKSKVSKKEFVALILKAGGAVQLGDMLKRIP